MIMEENRRGETELEKCYKELQQEWVSLNASKSHRSRCTKDHIITLSAIVNLLDSSPRQLLTSLQEGGHSNHDADPSKATCSITLVGDSAPSEGRSGDDTDRSRFKGKRLLKLLDDAAETSMLEEEVRSVCSSMVDQESVESRSCKEPMEAMAPDVGRRNDKDGEAEETRTPKRVVGLGEKAIMWEGGGGGGRWMERMGWLSVFMLVVALGIICMAGLDGVQEYDHGLVPT